MHNFDPFCTKLYKTFYIYIRYFTVEEDDSVLLLWLLKCCEVVYYMIVHYVTGIVDLGDFEPLTYLKAKALGIECRRLPIDIYKE